MHFKGGTSALDFEQVDGALRDAVMRWCAFILADLSPMTAYKYLSKIKSTPSDLIMSLSTCIPHNLRSEWNKLYTREIKYGAFGPISNFLTYSCRFSIGNWDSTCVLPTTPPTPCAPPSPPRSPIARAESLALEPLATLHRALGSPS